MAKKLFVVDTISTFRIRYVIEADELEHAFDVVTMEEADEFSQKSLGETIIDGSEISMKKFKKMLVAVEADKDELSSFWMGDKLIHKTVYPSDR